METALVIMERIFPIAPRIVIAGMGYAIPEKQATHALTIAIAGMEYAITARRIPLVLLIAILQDLCAAMDLAKAVNPVQPAREIAAIAPHLAAEAEAAVAEEAA